uniref:vesicle-fusing ATPase n=1 Tax=Raphidocystis contractilis TaxID=2792838 RepID=A0A809R7I5_RAPCO|nr:vacuolar protein-sorting-associated protein 4 variant 2 [Raphidocystis contractilis]
MTTSITQKAIEIMKQAVEADNNGHYEEAIKLYLQSIEHFMTGLKYEKSEKSKEMVRNKVQEYMDRVDYLKQALKNPKKKASAVGGGGKDPDDGNDEKRKFQQAIEGAIVREKPNVKWEQVVGLEGAKAALKEAVIYPLKFPHLFTGKRKPWKGILLYGPPGTGKSYLAKAVATEVDSTFFSVSSSDLVSKWLGESEKLVRNLFEMARNEQPSIVFIDEIDSLASTRSDSESESARRIKTEFLVQMQGVGHTLDGVLVLGATNIPWCIDSAVRRRFEKRIYIPLPDKPARQQMFKIHLGDTPNNLADSDFEELADMTEGYSGSDISVVVRDAIMEPIRKLQIATHFRLVIASNSDSANEKTECYEPCSPGLNGAKELDLMELDPARVVAPSISLYDFYKALRHVRPSVSEKDLVDHKKFTAEFGMEGA